MRPNAKAVLFIHVPIMTGGREHIVQMDARAADATHMSAMLAHTNAKAADSIPAATTAGMRDRIVQMDARAADAMHMSAMLAHTNVKATDSIPAATTAGMREPIVMMDARAAGVMHMSVMLAHTNVKTINIIHVATTAGVQARHAMHRQMAAPHAANPQDAVFLAIMGIMFTKTHVKPKARPIAVRVGPYVQMVPIVVRKADAIHAFPHQVVNLVCRYGIT